MWRKASRWATRFDSVTKPPPLSSSPSTGRHNSDEEVIISVMVMVRVHCVPTYHRDRVQGADELGGQRAIFHGEEDVLLVGQHRRPPELVMERASDAHRAQGEREGTYSVIHIT